MSEDPAVLFRLGRYEVVRRLGHGGMAEAFVARAPGADGIALPVVIKRILPHLATDPDLVNMFRDEARIMAHLRHPNIVRLLEFGESDGQYFLVMEQVDGTSVEGLREALAARGEALDLGVALFIASEVARALDFAHSRRTQEGHPVEIVHRDVTPSNVLLSAEGEVKLADFGIARARDRINRTSTESLVRGKIGYLPPEALGGKVDWRADLYALGVVLWELLAGENLVNGGWDPPTLAAVVRCDWPRVSDRRPSVPRDVADLVAKLLAPRPEDRPQRGRDVLRVLLPHLAALTAPSERLAALLASKGAPTPSAPIGEPPVVLLVDQSATFRALMRRGLAAEWTVIEAGTPEQALALARRDNPAAVVCQHLLETGTGLELCRQLQAFPECRGTPFVLVATEPSAELLAASREAGVTEVVAKSREAGPLAEALGRAVRGTDRSRQTQDLLLGITGVRPKT